MSEYQYYEFRAIDRPLNEKEMDELREISSRAEITPTSFTNTYNFGSFRGDPEKLLDRYFDAFVYVANWGTHRLMFRVPRSGFDVERALAYDDGEALTIHDENKRHIVIEFQTVDEGEGEWAEGEPWMPALVALRAELLRGDYRALYLGWLASLWYDPEALDEEDAERLEPPVPPGLAKLSAPLRKLAEFLRIDGALVEAAAANSIGVPPSGPSREELARWIGALPNADKDAYLTRLLLEENDLALRAELLLRFREATASKAATAVPGVERRTVEQLLAARDALLEEKKREAAEKAARQRAQRAREEAKARAKRLDDLALREPTAWNEVETLIAMKRAKEYEQAVELLVDLRELAARSGRADAADLRIQELRRAHHNKPAFLKRLDSKGLGT